MDTAEALQHWRGIGLQVIRVERMIIADGGQAVVGTVTAGTSLSTSEAMPQALAQSGVEIVAPTSC